MDNELILTLTDGLASEEEEIILERLRAYNVETFGRSDRRDLAIPLHGQNGMLIGGLTGYTARGWLHVSMLYVPEAMRGRGIASRMLDLAEAEARARDCIGAYIDTMNPEARRRYQRRGYTEIGSLKYLSGGHAVIWLEKRF